MKDYQYDFQHFISLGKKKKNKKNFWFGYYYLTDSINKG